MQRSGNRIRVNVQLVDAETAITYGPNALTSPVANLFDVQDEIISLLANTLNAELIGAEARRAERSLHPNSMDMNFQGRALWNKGPTAEHMAQARGFFERALALDPGNIEAMVGMASVDVAVGIAMLTDDKMAFCLAAEANAIKALSLAPDHAEAHLVLGVVYISTNRAAQGIAECEQALRLNPNIADVHSAIGLGKFMMGQAAETEGHILEALRLSPRDIGAYWWMFGVGRAKIQLGADAEAVAWLRRSINRNFPPAHFALAAALALIGAVDEARTAAKAGLALNPGFTIRRFRVGASSDNPTYLAGLERACTGMRLAGVPEA